MLKLLSIENSSGVPLTSFLLIAGIIVGALTGYVLPAIGESLNQFVDYTLLVLVGLLFFGVRLRSLLALKKNSIRFLAIALIVNFILVPLIGYGVASLLLSAHPLLIVGLVIYFMSPCTDWFLSFTRLAGGNVTLGTALIPINMTVQLLLYPVYLHFFAQHSVEIAAGTIANTLLQWFLLPLVIAAVLRQILRFILAANVFEAVLDKADQATVWVTAILVFQIFAGNMSVLIEHLSVVIWVLLAVFSFFVLTWLLGEIVSRLCKLDYPEQALLTMTIASRNAPLMLAVTIAALPNQPIIYSALVIGMLVEIPHLTALRRLLLKRQQGFVSEMPR